MGNALEFILKLTDQLSPAIKQAQRISDSATGQIERQFNNLQTSGKRMSASVDELRSRLDGINKVRFSTTIEKEFDTATRAARRLESEISTLENKGSKSGGGLLGGLGSLLPGIGIVGGIGKAVTASADAEMSRRSFGTLLQDQNKGNAMYGNLTKFATDTVFDNAGVYKNAQTLLSFGTAGDKILPTLKMLGDVSMGDQQRMDSLTLAFAQVGSAGKLSGQDLLQFINAGFNPLNEISKTTGISMADLKTKMEKGAISAEMVNTAFQHATTNGGMFHNALNNAATTVAGKWGNFMGTVQTKLVQLGDWFSPVTKLVLDFANGLMSGEPAALILAGGLGAVMVAIYGVSAATAVWNFITKQNPLMWVVTALIIVGTYIYSIMKQYDGWGKSTQGLWMILKGFGNLTVVMFENMAETIWYHIKWVWLKTKGFFEWINGAMGNVYQALQLAAKFDFTGAAKALTANITVSATQDIADLEKKHNAGVITNQQAAVAALQQMNTGKGMIGLTKVSGSSVSPALELQDAKSGNDNNTLLNTKNKSDGINSGGQRSIVINVGKMIDKMEVHVMNSKEASAEIEDAVRQALRKVMYNLNEAQPQ